MAIQHKTVVLSQEEAVEALIDVGTNGMFYRHEARDITTDHLVLAVVGHGTLVAFPFEYIVENVEVFEPFVELTIRAGESGAYSIPFTITVQSDTAVFVSV